MLCKFRGRMFRTQILEDVVPTRKEFWKCYIQLVSASRHALAFYYSNLNFYDNRKAQVGSFDF